MHQGRAGRAAACCGGSGGLSRRTQLQASPGRALEELALQAVVAAMAEKRREWQVEHRRKRVRGIAGTWGPWCDAQIATSQATRRACLRPATRQVSRGRRSFPSLAGAGQCNVLTHDMGQLQAHRFLSSWPYMSQLPMVFSRSLREADANRKMCQLQGCAWRRQAGAGAAHRDGFCRDQRGGFEKAARYVCGRCPAVNCCRTIVTTSRPQTHFRSK